jgi:putative membrane protein
MPRYLGLVLIGGGVLALVISCFQYVWIRHYLWSAQFQPIAGLREGGAGRTPSRAIAVALAVVGRLLRVAVSLGEAEFRSGPFGLTVDYISRAAEGGRQYA